ncbi:MAG: beta-galactosidase [Litorimonas sp.]
MATKPELGVCYYPEHWPEERWPIDAKQMVEMGLSWVRIGEFAWSRMEPEPGRLTFEWLDRAIAVLADAGLKIVICTPTATPPRWMVDKYPDMLAWDEGGLVRRFGSRRHYDFAHLPYREECTRIARLLGERYGQHPSVKAWQIDNEYGCHDTTLSYSPIARDGFRIWLKDKYQTIESLNQRWGTIFWSMEYNRFDQIELPNLTVTEPHPAHVMDFRRFASDQVVAFNKAQTDVLRELTDADLLHNYMGRITDFDHFAVGQDLDIATWDSYPLGFLEDRSDRPEAFRKEHAREGDADFQAFHHDLYRSVGKGRWWVMEQQPGPVNWAPHNPTPKEGQVRQWTFDAFDHGAEVVSYFRWRQLPFGQEQLHAGLLRTDGELSEGGKAVRAIASELGNYTPPKDDESEVAIVFDYPSQWAWEVQAQDTNFDYFRLVLDIYKGLRRYGFSKIDILPSSTTDFGDRKAVFIPGLFAWTDELHSAVSSFKGQAILGPRTGSRTDDFHIPDDLPPGLEGIKVIGIDTLRADSAVALSGGGAAQIWREVLECDWEVTETTVSGDPIVVRSGDVHYWAAWPDEEALRAWIASLLQ